MKKTLIALLAIGFIFTAVSITEAKSKKKPKVVRKSVVGTISSVSEDSLTITPKKSKKKDAEAPADVTVKIAEKTKIYVNGKKAKAEDLKEEMRVQVRYVVQESENTATYIRAAKPKVKKTK